MQRQARLRLAELVELNHEKVGRRDNNALNRSVHTFAVGLLSDGRKLPFYPTPFSLIYISRPLG